MKRYYEGKWFSYPDMDSIVYRPPGQYDDTMHSDLSQCIQIPRESISGLINFLDAEGYLKPRLDERLRVDDLKITHRLLDLLERKLPNSGGL